MSGRQDTYNRRKARGIVKLSYSTSCAEGFSVVCFVFCPLIRLHVLIMSSDFCCLLFFSVCFYYLCLLCSSSFLFLCWNGLVCWIL
ncbi:hypothetical protein BO83DRAFT_238279 [Aspergillus eucalypticola CBS 122712]|uniref:Uncharacterized protein n=1 Tax=Aspergillus eucalypticola (strain CBS 122712 / IBT 29274) TaxID=1448314 RepID=A0A317VUW8_ASPEC|nr:uncharacterized protein BO83DRAFT_238279 [Aspergillus eucalypticola CBS 122712]PWY76732.1 hypothetical protein BO83DRAFT_238279 [Aspergillus eucalypticola CBS 122712]